MVTITDQMTEIYCYTDAYCQAHPSLAAGRRSPNAEPECTDLDSKPIPRCKPIRHGRGRLLREDGAYFGKNSYGGFFGFKLHLLMNIIGRIVAAILTPANWDARAPARALSLSVDGGIALGDLD